VEVAELPGTVWVRDSKDPTGPVLRFGEAAFRAFVGYTRSGQLDRRY
jgi:hypothetical protein